MTASAQSLATGHDRTQFSDHADIKRLSADFVTVAGEWEKTHDPAKCEQLRGLRLRIVEALVAAKQPVDPALDLSVNAVVASCIKSGVRSFARTSSEENIFRNCLRSLDATPGAEAATLWFAAALLAWHALELPRLPTVAAFPQGLRSSWLSSAGLRPVVAVLALNGRASRRHRQRFSFQLGFPAVLLQRIESTPAHDGASRHYRRHPHAAWCHT
jgi:hypothetical protein